VPQVGYLPELLERYLFHFRSIRMQISSPLFMQCLQFKPIFHGQ